MGGMGLGLEWEGGSGRRGHVAQLSRMFLPVQEMQVRSLRQEDPLEKEISTHSSIRAWEIPWTEELDGLYSP